MAFECEKFEALLGDYIGAELERSQSREVAAHALRCLPCRGLLDDVKLRLSKSETWVEYGAELDDEFDQALEGIPIHHSRFGCDGFQALITEFLDGYVSASMYRRFVEHEAVCGGCSALLPGVIYAVAACHSVHTFEEVEPPASLTSRLLALPSTLDEVSAAMRGEIPAVKPTTRIQHGLKQVSDRFRKRTARVRRINRAVLAGAIAASFIFLVGNSLRGGALGDVFRKAQVKAGDVYEEGAEIYSRKEEMVTRFEMVGSRFNRVWKALEEDKSADQGNDADLESNNDKSGSTNSVQAEGNKRKGDSPGERIERRR